MDEDGKIDFSGYTPQELQEARSNINSKQYPKNLANLIAESERRGLSLVGPEATQPASQPKSRKIENGLWPSVSTWQGGEKAAKQGVWAAIFIAALSLALSIYSIRVDKILDDDMAAGLLIQGLIFTAVAFGMYKRSRVAAIFGLGWYVLIQAIEAWDGEKFPDIIAILLALMLVTGTRGIFAVHRIPEPGHIDAAERVGNSQSND